MWTFVWCVTVLFNGHDGKEPTDRLIPPGWVGNPWGPEATQARATGKIPPIPISPLMAQWDAWGKTVLRDGDLLFRRGDAKIAFGHFPFSRFIANASGSPFSHTGLVAIEDGVPVVYDTTKASVRRQPFYVWILDNAGPFGVKRVRPEHGSHAASAVLYCRDAFAKQVPFDYDLGLDDSSLYCVEMTEKAYRSSGLPLSEPIRLGDMEQVNRYPICIFVFLKISNLKLDQFVYFPGNERHGIWSSPALQTIYVTAPPPPRSARQAKSTTTAGGSGPSTAARAGAGANPR